MVVPSRRRSSTIREVGEAQETTDAEPIWRKGLLPLEGFCIPFHFKAGGDRATSYAELLRIRYVKIARF